MKAFGQPTQEEMLEIVRNFYLEVITINTLPDNQELVNQLNQATSTKEMHSLMKPFMKKGLKMPKNNY